MFDALPNGSTFLGHPGTTSRVRPVGKYAKNEIKKMQKIKKGTTWHKHTWLERGGVTSTQNQSILGETDGGAESIF